MFRATEVPVPMRTAMLWVGEDKSVVLRTFLVYIILMICYIFSGDNDRGFSRMSAVSMLLLFRCAGTSGHVIHVVCACCVTIFGRVGFSCVFCNRIAGITAQCQCSSSARKTIAVLRTFLFFSLRGFGEHFGY